MQRITITDKQADKRLDRVIKEHFPKLPTGAMFKAFRKKDVKVNGKRVNEDFVVHPGDSVEIYIVDSILERDSIDQDGLLNKGFSVVYEDFNLLIVNKAQGIPVHPDKEENCRTLIHSLQAYLQENGEYSPDDENSFPPALCHRLDRNTGGLIMAAKNQASLNILLNKIKTREIKKYYQCLVKGKMEKSQQELKAYLKKDEHKSRVYIYDNSSRDALEVITRYRVLDYDPLADISRLEVELVTGRTHQIRAHLSHIGHPVIGDGKYGTNAVNRPLGAKQQALWATRLVFEFTDGGMLNYLKEKVFEVKPEWKMK